MGFPYVCCRCGFCCITTTCAVGRGIYGVIDAQCPALVFDGVEASCLLVAEGLVPVGDGCCINARCYKDGKVYDFAGLPKEVKVGVAQAQICS